MIIYVSFLYFCTDVNLELLYFRRFEKFKKRIKNQEIFLLIDIFFSICRYLIISNH